MFLVFLIVRHKNPWIVCFALLCGLISHITAAPGKGQPLTSCNATSLINTSKDICGDLCEKGAPCLKSGICLCNKEPVPSNLGGHFVHCTNWDYVDQDECRSLCKSPGKNDTRVCWTFTIGNYCTCF